jgi:hypothetical protein
MIARPTHGWRRMREERLAEAAASGGPRSAGPWTPEFLDTVDTALEAYETEVARMNAPCDDEVLATVERVVLALNDAQGHGHIIDTIDREELCDYIDEVLVRAGIDADALAARQHLTPGDLGGRWRDW